MGNVLVRKLLEAGHQVRVFMLKRETEGPSLKGLDVEKIYGDVRDRESVKAAMQACQIVFHLAAKISLFPDTDGSVWAINVEGTRNVAEIALEQGIERFVHCSSHAALDKYPYSEVFDETRPLALKDKSVYHRSKAHGEQVILDMMDKGLPAMIVNPGTIIGPYDFGPSLIGQALIDLTNGKLAAIMEGSSDYADARDIAQGMIDVMEKGRVGERYFLTGHLVTMKELSVLIGKITGKKTPKTVLPLWLMYALLPFIQLAARIKGVKPMFTKDMLHASQSNPEVSHAKANKEFGFSPRKPEEAFKATMDWFAEQGLLG